MIDVHHENLIPARGRRALVTGVTGQDGYYLSRLLLERGCRVWGTCRPGEEEIARGLQRELVGLEPLVCDLEAPASIDATVAASAPDVVYHLAAQSSVGHSWRDPLGTARTNALGTLELLECLRRERPETALVLAGSCDCFDHDAAGAQGVTPATPFKVSNPYAASKVMAHQLAHCYRQEYGLRASVAIFFNHTSPRRPPMFVERGIVRAAVEVSLGLKPAITIGSWETRRDWSWAPELMEGFAAIGGLEQAGDYVLASGVARTVRDWVMEACGQLGLDAGSQVEVDTSRLHPGDRPHTHGNIEASTAALGWAPKMQLAEMVAALIAHDRAELGR